jgi:hypothetical protein
MGESRITAKSVADWRAARQRRVEERRRVELAEILRSRLILCWCLRGSVEHQDPCRSMRDARGGGGERWLYVGR